MMYEYHKVNAADYNRSSSAGSAAATPRAVLDNPPIITETIDIIGYVVNEIQEATNRLRSFADDILGSVPTKDGSENGPPAVGRGNSLRWALTNLRTAQDDLRAEVRRIDSI